MPSKIKNDHFLCIELLEDLTEAGVELINPPPVDEVNV
jgi:hypothetical protein